MARIRVEFINRDQVIKKLNTDYPNRLRVALINALSQGAEEGANIARRLVPVKTGSLQSTIEVKKDISNLRVMLSAGGGQIDYAEYQEYGTMDKALNPNSLRYIRNLIETGAFLARSGKGVPPVLYLNRAAYLSRNRMKVLLQSQVNALIKQLGGKKK